MYSETIVASNLTSNLKMRFEFDWNHANLVASNLVQSRGTIFYLADPPSEICHPRGGCLAYMRTRIPLPFALLVDGRHPSRERIAPART